MKLKGSCRCNGIAFEVLSSTPYPFMRCYCSIGRKVAGSSGYAVNLGAHTESLIVKGKENIHRFVADIDGNPGSCERAFCRNCGTALWVYSQNWPELIHPFASAIDTPLPELPEIVHIMLDFKPHWIKLPQGHGHKHFNRYPKESLSDWHHRQGLYKECDS